MGSALVRENLQETFMIGEKTLSEDEVRQHRLTYHRIQALEHGDRRDREGSADQSISHERDDRPALMMQKKKFA